MYNSCIYNSLQKSRCLNVIRRRIVLAIGNFLISISSLALQRIRSLARFDCRAYTRTQISIHARMHTRESAPGGKKKKKKGKLQRIEG